MSMEVEALVCGLLVPFAVAAAVLLPALRWLPGKPPGLRPAAAALALGLGCCAGQLAFPWTPLAPRDTWHWLPYLALTAAAAGAGEGFLPALPRWAGRLGIAALAAWLLVPAWDDLRDTRPLWQLGLTAAVLALWAALDLLAFCRPTWPLAALLAPVLPAAAVVLERSGSLKFAQLAGVLLAAWAPLALAELRPAGRGLVRGAAPVLAVVLSGLVFTGRLWSFSDVPMGSYLLLLLTPAVLAAALLLPFPTPPSRRGALVAAALLAPLAAAMTLAASA